MKHDNSVDAVACSPDGTTVLTASGTFTGRSGTGVALFWDAPHRIPDQLVGLVASTRLRARLNDEGRVEEVSDEEYATAWKKLEAEGAEWLAECQRQGALRIIGWHHYETAEAEARGDWFAAEFHLRWLLKSEPDDADLRTRYEHAKQSLAASRAVQHPPVSAPPDGKR